MIAKKNNEKQKIGTKLFYFDVNKARINFIESLKGIKTDNEFSSTSSITANKKTEKDNEEIINKQKEVTIIFEKKDEQNSSKNTKKSIPIDDIKKKHGDSSKYIEDRIPIDEIKNSDGYYNDNNLETNDTTDKTSKKPTYYIPFKKIFKEDKKEIAYDELKINDYGNNNKENEQSNNPAQQRRKKIEENKIFSNENSNCNTNNLNLGFTGFNRDDFYSNNKQNNSKYILDYLKIIKEEQQFNELKRISIFSLMNGNLNNYLLSMLINNNGINNYNSLFNYTQFNPFNNNINYLGNNIYGNCFPNNNIINNLQHQKNINNINNPEKYTITLKSKTNDPSIEKISKIQVTTSFIKDNSKAKQENDNPKSQNIKNIINLNDIVIGKETRTVVRLNPIPPNYSSFDVCKLLDMHLKIESGKNQRIYKALYTPLCKVIGKNLGYCFVMMVKPKYVIDFYNVFNGKIFGKKKCKKPCKVIWADIQGEEFLKASEDDPIRKPIIFKDIIIDKEDL